jgi:hypothetical protein
MVKVSGEWICRECSSDAIDNATTNDDPTTPPQRSASLEELPTTDAGSVRKQQAMEWLSSLSEPSAAELQHSFLAKPSDFTGGTYPTSISNIRITGDAKFVETVAGLLKPIQELEGGNTRVEINLQETEDRDTGETTGNYALYLSVAERG